MTDVNLSSVLGGGAATGGGYDATAYQMIRSGVSEAAITAGWKLSDRREVFDRLVYNLYGVTISNSTTSAAFDDAADALLLIQNAEFVDDLNSDSHLLALGLASAALSDYAIVYGMDLSTASYAAKSLSVSAQDNSPYGLAFSPDGASMYIAGHSSDRIYQYTLSVPWDVSTASYASKSLYVFDNGRDPSGVVFSPDGSVMIVFGSYGDTLYQYTLSTPWDVSTGSYASKLFTLYGEDTSTSDVAVSPDGLTMFSVGAGSDRIYQYTLSVPWDVSTASYASKSLSVSAQETTPYGIAVSADGKTIFITGSITDRVYLYTLETPWDVSTGSYASKSLAVGSQEPEPRGVAFSADGTGCYVVGIYAGKVHQYSGTALAGGVFLQAT